MKLILDAVHGYVEIDDKIFTDFIDTPQFQRLRNIKQTIIDVLYPSATHSRFEHSIGVYYLGRRIIDSIIKKNDANEKIAMLAKKYRPTVELACLLHDIGHAPLSHLGEQFYPDSAKLLEELKGEGVDLSKCDKKPASHEVMSCLVALRKFKPQIKKYKVDKDLFCRMITGVDCTQGVDKSFKNALINILSGAYDSDKIDYIMRDSNSAGIVTMVLDIARIVGSFNIINKDGTYIYVIEKSGFSVAEKVVENRNYLVRWVYNHHKVQYCFEIARRYLRKIKNDNKNFVKLFSYDAITGKIKTGIKYVEEVELIDDIDIWKLLKYYCAHDAVCEFYRKKLFDRQHFKPLWKTDIEFDKFLAAQNHIAAIWKIIESMAVEVPEDNIEKKVIELSGGKLTANDFLIFMRAPKLSYPLAYSREAQFYLPKTKEFVEDDKLFSRSLQEVAKEKRKMLYMYCDNSANYKIIISALSRIAS